MSGPRIGSLFTGTGALDLAVMDVYGGEVAWHSQYEPPDKNGREDTNQYAARILARHWPDVPNLGDITKVDWTAVIEEHGPIDILTGGFPCTDVSSAGRRAGLTPDTRSGLWTHMARAISVLQPQLVVIENVQGLLSAPAASDVEPCPRCVGDGSAEPSLRALGAVLGDLARLGFDAEWCVVAASEVGAPHARKRVFVLAWPATADADSDEPERRGVAGILGSSPAEEPGQGDQRERAGHPTGHRGEAATDATNHGHERGRGTWRRGHGPADRSVAAADADGGRREWNKERDGQSEDGQPEGEPRLDTAGRGVRRETAGTGRPNEALADAQGFGRGEGRPEPAGQQGRPDAPQCGRSASSHADDFGQRTDILGLRPGQPDADWGPYGPAIQRWERVLGRRAPWPTDVQGRLSPVFTEWLMGLPDGWVTNTPGLTRAAMLKALGNGVVRLQAATAIRHLHERAGRDRHPAA